MASKTTETTHRCSICEREFETHDALVRHVHEVGQVD
jgi:hypothetical protein